MGVHCCCDIFHTCALFMSKVNVPVRFVASGNRNQCPPNSNKHSSKVTNIKQISPNLPHSIHVWYIYVHVVDFYGTYVGKYTIHGCYGYINVWILEIPIHTNLSLILVE